MFRHAISAQHFWLGLFLLLDPLPLSLGLSSSRRQSRCFTVRLTAVQCAACPHVGLSLQPTLEAPREGLRQGEVRGGGWKEAESTAPKPLLRSGHHGGEGPTGWATHNTEPRTHSGSENKNYIIQRQQTYLYPDLPYIRSTGQST